MTFGHHVRQATTPKRTVAPFNFSAGMDLPSLYKQIQRGQSAAQILGLKEQASVPEIRGAMRSIALKIHTDKAPTSDLVDLHTSLFKKMQVAAGGMLLKAETHAGRAHQGAPHEKQNGDVSSGEELEQPRDKAKKASPGSSGKQSRSSSKSQKPQPETCSFSAVDAAQTPEQRDDKPQVERGTKPATAKPGADEVIDDWEAEEQRLEHKEDILAEKAAASKKPPSAKSTPTPTPKRQKPCATFDVPDVQSARERKGKEAPSKKSKAPTGLKRPKVKVAYTPALASSGKPALRLLDKDASLRTPMPWESSRKKKGGEPWQRRAKPATASKKHKLTLASNGKPALRLLDKDATPPEPMPWERRKNGWRRAQEKKESQQRKPKPATASKEHKLALASNGKPALRLLDAPPPSPKPWEPQTRHQKKAAESIPQQRPRLAALYKECKPALASNGTPALQLPAPPTGLEPRLWTRYVPRPKKKAPLRGQRVRMAEPPPSAIVAFVRDEAMRDLHALLKELASKKRKAMTREQLKEMREKVQRLCRVAGLRAPM